jgi:diguanylate cyclase (GGDEF)-like protein
MGMVYAGEHIKVARFLKYGANHCIVRQMFLPEEFYCMVRLLIENIEHMQQLRSTGLIDFLTGLHNRRYFFITGEKLFASARRQSITLVCAMIDIDFFKKVNDEFGHEAGDRVLQHVANILSNRLRKTDIVARISGEEFCILAVNMDTASVHRIFDELRRQIEQSAVVLDDGMGEVKITVSIGISTQLGDSLDHMLKQADFHLYEAKESGRNRLFPTCDFDIFDERYGKCRTPGQKAPEACALTMQNRSQTRNQDTDGAKVAVIFFIRDEGPQKTYAFHSSTFSHHDAHAFAATG